MNFKAQLLGVGSACLLLTGLALWLIGRFIQGDGAAVLGALTIGLVPLVIGAFYGSWLWEKHPDTQGMSVSEARVYFQEGLYPRIKGYVVPLVFFHTVVIGLWIGLIANRPILFSIVHYVVWRLISGVLGAKPSVRTMALMVVTLAVSAVLGQGVRKFIVSSIVI